MAVGAGVYAALGALLYFAQRSLLYYPTPPTTVPGATSMQLSAGGETLRIWTRPRPGARALIYFGGNAEDVGGHFAPLSQLLPDHALFLVNYRGYGGSTGSPTEAGLLADALVVYDEVARRHGQVDVIGNSLGSGVAVYLAQQRPVRRLVLVTPYDSIARVAAGHYPLFPVSWLIRDRFDSASRAPDIKAPVLAFIAENDRTIPRERSDGLIAAFPPGRVRVEVLKGADHNDVGASPRYYQELGAFLTAQ